MTLKHSRKGLLYRTGFIKVSPEDSSMAFLLILSVSALMLFNDNYKTYIVSIFGIVSGCFLFYMGRRMERLQNPSFNTRGFLKKTVVSHVFLIPLAFNFLFRRIQISLPSLPYKMAALNRVVVAVYIVSIVIMIIRPFLSHRFIARIDGLSILTGFLGAGILSYPPLSALVFFRYNPMIYLNSIAFLLISNVFLSFGFVFLFVDGRFFPRDRKKHWGLMIGASFILFFFTVAVIMDNIYLYYSGRHFDAELWGYVFDSHVTQNMKIYSNTLTFFMASAFVGYVLLYVACLRKMVRKSADRKSREDSLSSVVFAGYMGMAVLSVLLIVSPYPRNSSLYETWSTITASPPVNLITSFADFSSVESMRKTKVIPVLTPGIENRLIRSGIPFASKDPRFPFYKESIHDGPPEPKNLKPVLPENTNLVIVMAESFSKWFLSEEARKLFRAQNAGQELTPSIDAMAARGIVFEKMLSPVRGTKLGHIAILGSWFETNRRTNESVGNQGQDYLFLSEILANRGYRCLHIQGTSSEFNSEKDMFTKHGFKEFYSYESLELLAVSERLSTEDKGLTSWGYSDDVVFRFAVEKIKTIQKQPFLLTVSTMDTHTPYNGGNLLDGIHSTDKAFGHLMDYIRQSGLDRNTAVLFIADHAPRSEADYLHIRNFMSGGDIPTDWIAAIMKLPGNPEWNKRRVGTVCSQTDITPTLLDMMGIDTPNPFIGLSVFSDRPDHPVLVGLHTMAYDKGASCLSVTGTEKRKLSKLLEWITYHKRVIGYRKGVDESFSVNKRSGKIRLHRKYHSE